MWLTTVESGTTQMTIWRMRIAHWILKATNTHTQTIMCNTYYFPTAIMVERTRFSVTLYVLFLLCIIIPHCSLDRLSGLFLSGMPTKGLYSPPCTPQALPIFYSTLSPDNHLNNNHAVRNELLISYLSSYCLRERIKIYSHRLQIVHM